MISRRLALLARASLLVLAVGACDTRQNPTLVVIGTPGTSTFVLATVNGSGLPYTDPSSGETWQAGRWQINADSSFSASFDVATGPTPGTIARSGVIRFRDSAHSLVVYSTGTTDIADLTTNGFRVPFGSVTLGFVGRTGQ
jgi:hypothetical protein